MKSEPSDLDYTVLALAFVFLIIQGENEFFAMNESTEQYIQGEKAAQQLEKGADYLTEQVRMYVMTGDTSYMDAYFVEPNQVKSRENALDTFKTYFDRTASFSALKLLFDSLLNSRRQSTGARLWSVRQMMSCKATGRTKSRQ